MQSNVPERQKPTKAHAPRNPKGRAVAVLPALLLFIGLLIVMYILFPKEAGKRVGSSIYDGLYISEVMASNSSAVPDENGEFHDWLELHNNTGADLNLEGVKLANRTDRIAFPFPSFVLKAGERVIVFASDSYQLELDKPFHGKFKITAAGAHLYLYDPSMYLIDEVITPALPADNSYMYMRTNENGVKEYEVTEDYSPGYENTLEGSLAYHSANTMVSGELIINEVCPAPKKVGLQDDDNEIVDWVELRNTTDQPISLAGFYLSNKETKPMKWRFPESAIIPANGYYLIFCSGKNKLQEDGIPHTNFGVSAEKATIVLSDSYGRTLDRISIENVPTDYSVGRNKDGAWEFLPAVTPKYTNGQSKSN